MSPMQKTLVMMLLLTVWPLAGCRGFVQPVPIPSKPSDHTKALALHPQFKTAATVAPEFTKACFRTITDLELQLANAGK